MTRDKFANLIVFVAVARQRSFTRAAAQLRVSQAALSYAVKSLEQRMGAALLVRHTRNLALTPAGQRLLDRIGAPLDAIHAEIEGLADLRDQPTGKIRITAIDYAVKSTLWPKLAKFLPRYPDIRVELVSEYASVDIVAQGYDAGVRFGAELALDMISVRIGPDILNTVVGSPAYLASRPAPATPADLCTHACINLRMATHGGLYEWEFSQGGIDVNARVDGSLIFNNAYDILEAARAGFGLAYLPEDMVRPYLQRGELVSVLADWCPTWEGLHLYYPNRWQPSRAMTLLVEALRHRP